MKSTFNLRPPGRRSAWFASLATAVLAISSVHALAAGFTGGNLVVLRDGDGSVILASSGNQLFLDQYTIAGTLVNSTAIPSNGPSALLDSGAASSEGGLTLAANGTEVVVAGYHTSFGYGSSLPSSTSAAVPRALATVDSYGNYTLGPTTSTAFSANNIRSGTTDGTNNFWAAGATSGINYLGTGTAAALGGTVVNSRIIQEIGGNLYYSTGSGQTRGIYEISGLPTFGAVATNILVPTGTNFASASSPYGFAFDPSMSVCYVADSSTYTNRNTCGGVEKWTNNGNGYFGFAYTLQPGPAGITNGAVGLAVSFGSTTNIYGTLSTGTNIFVITDNGPSSVGTLLYSTLNANINLRGMCWAPTNNVVPPAITSITPASVITNAGATATFTVAATGGAPLSYYWYFETATSTNVIPFVNSPTLTLPNLTAANSGNYQVVVSNASLMTITSSVVSLAVGSFIVVQEGDGVQTLGSSGNEVFLNQYTASGILVSSQAIPTNGPTALIQTGNSAPEGMVSLATNGQELVIAGYNVRYGYTNNSIGGTDPSVYVPRAVATVDSHGNYNLAATSTSFFNTYNIRSATSDGNGNYWAAGSGGNTPAAGIAYIGTAAPSVIGGTVANSRVVQDIGGNLYYSTGSDKRGIIEITGQPTSGAVTTNYVIPTGATISTASSPYGFQFDPGMTVCYVADSNTYTNSTTLGGVEKWTNSGSAWGFAYTLQPGPAGNTNGAVGLIVSFGTTTNLYGTLANGTNIFAITDTGPSSIGSVIYTALPTVALRGICFAPTNAVTPAAPTITAITPSSTTLNVGSSVTFTLTDNPGFPAASATWYKIANSATNSIVGQTGTTLTLNNLQVTDTAGYYAVLANASGSATSSVASLTVVAKPTISGISPSSVITNAGQTVTFALSATTGTPPASNFWYKITGSNTNLIAGATGTSLTLTNVLGSNSGGYFAILTNASGSATSSVATLSVIDPIIEVEPNNAVGLLDGTVQFSVTVAGYSPAFQWYYSDGNGNLLGQVLNGNSTLSSQATVSGAAASTLSIANLQLADLTGLTNLVVVVTNVYGSATSSPASLLSVATTQGMLAFWDFDGPQFTNTAVNPNCINNPAPLIGNGTAAAVGTCYDPGTSPFAGSVDPNDQGYDGTYGGWDYTPFGYYQPSPNNSWGTDNYTTNNPNNKQNGVQFNVSTVGAKNLTFSYQARATGTASEYERVQFTTNGTVWIDYPTSTSFGGLASTYEQFTNSFVGFPNVDNNPNFGIRLVAEYQSTATYGVGTTNFYMGDANTYGTAGTLTYDLVAIQGDAITNNNVPPVLSSFMNTNVVDTNTDFAVSFGASSSQMAASNLTITAVSLVPAVVDPNFTVVYDGGTNFTLNISFPSPTPDPLDAAPIMVTATDTNGESTVGWFVLTVGSINQPPTNKLISATNTLANTPVTIPFIVGSARNPYTNLTYSVATDNGTVIPAANINIGGNTNSGNPTVTVLPDTNQVGNAVVYVTVNDNDPVEPRSTTASIAITVLPNTNVLVVDYFSYDGAPGALDTLGVGYWQHLSGNNNQLQVANGVVTMNQSSTESLQTPLRGGPYLTNSGVVLYSSLIVNDSTLPKNNGTYFICFNDGSGNTANVEDCLVVATNGAAPGYYRLGIANGSASATNAQMFPQDLSPNVNYVVVTSLVLSNGFSTLWINPTNQSAQSVTDTTPPANPTNLYNIADFDLREGTTATEGILTVGSVMAGRSFNSVIYPPVANSTNYAITENSSATFSPLLIDAGWSLSLASVSALNGTVTISGNQLQVLYTPASGFTGSDTIRYTNQDNLGNLSSSTITVVVTNIPPLVNPVSYTVLENSANNVLNPLTNDVVETPGGSLSLVSLSPTNGTATISGNQVLFTPTTGFLGAATIGYTVTDSIGGTNSSLITVAVTPGLNLLSAQVLSSRNLVISWSNSTLNLQYSTNVAGPYITIPGAASPYTNLTTTNAAGFFRLSSPPPTD